MYPRLRDLREDNDMTQAALAKLLGMSQTGYSKYETGENDVPTQILIKTTATAVVFSYLMRRAQQCRARTQSAASLPSHAPHGVRRGCWMNRIAGVHGEAMYTASTLRSACSSSRLRLPMQTPFFWTGDARFLSTERKWGSRSCSAYGAASPRHKCRDPLRTCAEKGALYGLYNESHCQNPL